jgi:GNAT superfamily N-acetyltransferase
LSVLAMSVASTDAVRVDISAMTKPADAALRVVRLRESQLAPVATLLAQALESDAAYSYLFPAPSTRAIGLSDFFSRNLRMHLPYACTFVALDAGERAIATVTLRPPSGIEVSLWTLLRRGLLPFAITHGGAAVRRMLWLKRAYDELEVGAAAHAPHAHVHMMAVAPEHQGRGLGSRLLADVLAAHVVTQTVLTTHLRRNIAFYRRHGFELLSERTLHPPRSHAYPVWSMRRAGLTKR